MNTIETAINPRIIDIKDYSPFHQRITLGPFERGYGHTIGNAIRRVLLTAVPGFAPTSVRIEGVEHQYSSIPGVSEDVIELLLNIKGVAFRIEGSDTATVELHKSSSGNATAADFTLPGNVSVINPDHHIATLANDATLELSVVIQGGRGYQLADNTAKDRVFGTLLLDAAFSPVRNVAIDIESTRVDNRTDLDQLTIDLKTNGIHNPEEMVRFAAQVLIDQLSLFTNLAEGVATLQRIGTRKQNVENPLLNEPLDVLNANVRVLNHLKQENIHLISDLVNKTEKELLATPRLGRKSVDEIKIALAECGLELGMQADLPANQS